MKKRYLVLTALLALSLAACSQEKAKNEDGAAKTEQTAKADGTVGNKTQEATQKKAEVVNKGDYYSIQGKYDEIIVANKHYPLSKDYNPGENPTAKAELVKLIKAMQEAGFPISDQYSGFRSYETQTKLYQDYVNKDGKAAADRYSARPGYSEHQTGLAFDVIGTNGDLVTEEKAAQWLLDHAADYGFVVRYLKGKEKETGYLVIGDHQYFAGYSLFLAKEHVTELHHLEKETRLRFLEEMSVVQEAVAKAFVAEKMNIELLGNGDAHLHWHLFPRRTGDMNGHGLKGRGPVWWVPFEEMTSETCQAKPDEIKRLVKLLSSELDKLLEIKE